MNRCDCEPIVHSDGSHSHEPECAAYPWCPHEVVAVICPLPCVCPCDGCQALTEGGAR